MVQVTKLQVAFPISKQVDHEPRKLVLMISRHFAVREIVECTSCEAATGMCSLAVLSVTVCLDLDAYNNHSTVWENKSVT